MSIIFSLQIKRRIIWRQSLLFGKFGLDALPLVYDTKKSLITKLGCNLVTPLKPRGIYSAGCAYTRRNAAMPQCGAPEWVSLPEPQPLVMSIRAPKTHRIYIVTLSSLPPAYRNRILSDNVLGATMRPMRLFASAQ